MSSTHSGEIKNDYGNPIPVTGTVDIGNLPAVQTVKQIATTLDCYSAQTPAITPVANATNVFVITGSATKLIRILRVDVSAISTATSISNWRLFKYSTLPVGGTITVVNAVAWDTLSPLPTAVCRLYTTNPVVGTPIGGLRKNRVCQAAATAAAVHPTYSFDLTNSGLSAGVTLRGVNEYLAVDFNGAAIPAGLSVEFNVDWIEE